MLVLARKTGEGIRIGDEIVITVVSTESGHVRLGIEAPTRITIHREEVYDQIAAANRQAAPTSAMAETTTINPTPTTETPE